MNVGLIAVYDISHWPGQDFVFGCGCRGTISHEGRGHTLLTIAPGHGCLKALNGFIGQRACDVEIEECVCCGESKPVSIRDANGYPICLECRCECCGAVGAECDCEIGVEDGYDRETGPYADRGCATHRCRV